MTDDAFIVALNTHAKDDAAQFEAITEALAGIAKDIGSLSERIKEFERRVDDRFTQIEDKLAPLVEVYDGLLLGNKVIMWVAGIVGAIATIGAAAVWIWSSLFKQ